MRLFPKILTVTLSLIACAALTTRIIGSPTRVDTAVRSAGSQRQSATPARGMALVLDPSSWLTNASAFMVIAYLDGIARQERADADAAEAARSAKVGSTCNPVTCGYAAPTPAAPSPPPDSAPYVGGIHAQPFLICVRRHESDRSDVNGNGLHDGGYAAKNPSSSAAGAYQFLTSTWNSVVNAMGHPEWVGDPRDFSDDIQDQVAWWTYQNQGAGPWSGSGCS